jgi:hypothetical protein
MKLIKQSFRGQIALGIQGTPEEVQSRLDSLINWGAITSHRTIGHPYDGLHLGDPMSFQYVLLSEESLRDYLINIVSLDFDIERIDMATLPLLAYIRKQANMIMANISNVSFIPVALREREERSGAQAKARAEIRALAEEYKAKCAVIPGWNEAIR